MRLLVPTRPQSSHKGTFGHTGIVAGSPGKAGAPALAALGALRIGTGLVTVATPHSVTPVVESKLLEVMTQSLPETSNHLLGASSRSDLLKFSLDKSAMAIGPGIGVSPSTSTLFSQVLSQFEAPCVLDADALNNLTANLKVLSKMKRLPVLTPHPGEMARLTNYASAKFVNSDRIRIATAFAKTYKVISSPKRCKYRYRESPRPCGHKPNRKPWDGDSRHG